MMTTANVLTHRKRYCFGMAVMAMAMTREARAQQTEPTPLIKLAAQAATEGNDGLYDEQLTTLEQIAAIEYQAAPNPSDPAARQAQIDTFIDLGLRLDGAGHTQQAIEALQHALALSSEGSQQNRFVAQLALAHAERSAGNAAESEELCHSADPHSISASERRTHLLGTTSVLAAQKQLFCGDPAAGKAALMEELAHHPNMPAPHQVLSEYDLVTHEWPEAQQEFIRWQRAAGLLIH